MDRQKQIKERAKQFGVKYRGTYMKAVEGNSRLAGVRAKCLECLDENPADIAVCQSGACPLWPYRPFQKRHKVRTPQKNAAETV